MGNMVKNVAPLQKRNYVILEVMNNLLVEGRKATLDSFPNEVFKKVAQVTLGEPNADFTQKTHEELLRRKQYKCDEEFKIAQAEKKRQKLAEKRKKEIEKAQKKRAKEADKKKKEAEKAKKAAEEAKEGDEEKKEDEKENDKEA